VIRHGTELHESILLLEGWMARTTAMASGHQQISELQFCGDFVDLHGFTLKRLDHNVMAITDCRYAVFPHERLRAMLEKHPHLTRVYWLMTNIDAAIHREWTVSLGRRQAPGRMAHLFCEILERLKIVGQQLRFPAYAAGAGRLPRANIGSREPDASGPSQTKAYRGRKEPREHPRS
jgi:CRP-like cAMP-binding protein